MNALLPFVVLIAGARTGPTASTDRLDLTSTTSPSAPDLGISSTTAEAREDQPRLEFSRPPQLFEPILVDTVGLEPGGLLYLSLEIRPADVLPGREDTEWRTILTKSAYVGAVVEFGCEWVTATGLYRVRASSENSSRVLFSAAALLLQPLPASRPRLALRADSIFPHCQRDFDLAWALPNCSLATKSEQFRVRVLATDARDAELYMGELRAQSGPPRSFGIPCAQFDIIHERFCFELVSLHAHTQQLDLWDRKCVHTEPVQRVDGGWSEWSEWSACTRSCGRGRRKRRRACARPAPRGGRFCAGRVVQVEPCNAHACPLMVLANRTARAGRCECGCVLTEAQGSLFAGDAPACWNRTRHWVVPARFLARLRLVFVEKLAPHQLMRVSSADGETFWTSRPEKSLPAVLMLPLDTDVNIVLTASSTSADKPAGVFIDYQIIPEPSITESGDEYSALLGSRLVKCRSRACHAIVTVCSLLLCLAALLVLVVVPPLLCSLLTRRRAAKRKAKNGLLHSYQAESEMVRSAGTDSTRVSAGPGQASQPAVARRSIGVQRSLQTTPRVGLSARDTPRPAASIASMDLEYDYYDPPLPGSFIKPAPPDAPIDIDRIVEEATSGWLDQPPKPGQA